MSPLQSNLIIGGFLGSGHFGQVHIGKDDLHGDVAVKIMRQEPSETPLKWEKRKLGLLQEGKRLSAAAHPNVVRVLHVVQSDTSDAVHLVMELCTGGSLQKHYDAGPMKPCDVRKIGTDIALGLHALHGRQMIHRDIKPGNLLLAENGIAKLGDFGLVTDEIVCGYASINGYKDHVAYEVWGGVGTSTKSDIWAFGMTLYRMLHGHKWYSASPAPHAIIADGGFAETLAWLPHIPKPWRRFIKKTLQDDPDRRYQNADQLIAALGQLPIEPRWECSVTPNEVKWKRKSGDRHVSVIWTKHSTKTHTWTAWSEPIGKGKKRTLGGSTTKIGGAKVDRELRDFFATQT